MSSNTSNIPSSNFVKSADEAAFDIAPGTLNIKPPTISNAPAFNNCSVNADIVSGV